MSDQHNPLKDPIRMIQEAKENNEEPTFTVRAKDAHSLAALNKYIESISSLDSCSNDQFIQQAKDLRDKFIKWRTENIRQVRWPD